MVGARPQFVKAAVLSRAFNTAGIEEKIIHTGQHFDHGMSDVFFQEMQIPYPHFNLGVNGMGHGAMTGAMLAGIEDILINEKPDIVLVYGDTNSTLAGALAASKLHIPIAHVEAGLRSFNMEMPEEINRILTDRISTLLFAPTDTSVENLKREGFDSFAAQVFKTGDVMQDAALFYARTAEEKSDIIQRINLDRFILCTIHRAENTDSPERLKQLVSGLNQLNDEIPVVLPLHPRTQKIIEQQQLKLNVRVIPPVGYFDMLCLLKNCELVITDSGGLQKEAYFFAKNCVTMRDQTEWIELVNGGYNVLVGANSDLLVRESHRMLSIQNNFDTNLYGGGNAGQEITEQLVKWHNKQI